MTLVFDPTSKLKVSQPHLTEEQMRELVNTQISVFDLEDSLPLIAQLAYTIRDIKHVDGFISVNGELKSRTLANTRIPVALIQRDNESVYLYQHGIIAFVTKVPHSKTVSAIYAANI